MRILLINSVHYIRGGADRVYFNTGKLLEDNGHEVFYFSQKDEKNDSYKYETYFPKRDDVRKAGISTKLKRVLPFIYNVDAANKLQDYINIIKPDIAHIHLFMGGLSSSILNVLRDNNIPIVHTAHDYRLICPAYAFLDANDNICEKCKKNKYYYCLINKCSSGNLFQSVMLTLDAYFRLYINKAHKLIDQVVFVSKFSMDKHIEYNKLFSQKSTFLYNFNSNTEKDNFPDSDDYILYFGRISVEKGIDTLLKACGQTHLKIVGAVDNDIKGSNNVEYLGYKSGDELTQLIAKAKFVIVPSQWYENNPMTVVESYSLNTPVIGSDIGGISEIIQDGITGYLFKPFDSVSLEEAINKGFALPDSEYKDMCENAYNFSNDYFSNSTHYNSLIKTYSKVIDSYGNK